MRSSTVRTPFGSLFNATRDRLTGGRVMIQGSSPTSNFQGWVLGREQADRAERNVKNSILTASAVCIVISVCEFFPFGGAHSSILKS